MRLDRTRLSQHLTTLNVFTLGTTQQHAHVVARLTLIQQFAEHLHTRARRLLRVADTHNLKFLANLDDAALNTTRHHCTATRNREHVFNRHQERTVDRTLWRRNVAVQCIGQFHDRRFAQVAFVAFQGQLG
ncbi:hypothetical protein MCEMAEM21_01759 [Oxalobacteraceae bacterium]